MRWQLCGSLLLHVAILLALIWLRPVEAPKPVGEEPVHVEIVNALPRPLVSEGKPQITDKRAPSPLTAEKISKLQGTGRSRRSRRRKRAKQSPIRTR